MKRADKIIALATRYLNRLEKPDNKGFYNAEFEKEMKVAGWYVGAAWCAFFTKLIWSKAYADYKPLQSVVDRMANGGALMTLNNFKNNGQFPITQNALPGSIAIWRMGDGSRGHAGIVVRKVDANTIETIEGNTNTSGSREGDRVAAKLRTLNRPFKADGLNLYGFINPIEI